MPRPHAMKPRQRRFYTSWVFPPALRRLFKLSRNIVRAPGPRGSTSSMPGSSPATFPALRAGMPAPGSTSPSLFDFNKLEEKSLTSAANSATMISGTETATVMPTVCHINKSIGRVVFKGYLMSKNGFISHKIANAHSGLYTRLPAPSCGKLLMFSASREVRNVTGSYCAR